MRSYTGQPHIAMCLPCLLPTTHKTSWVICTCMVPQAALQLLLAKETRLLQTIDKLRVGATAVAKEKRADRALTGMAAPVTWELRNGAKVRGGGLCVSSHVSSPAAALPAHSQLTSPQPALCMCRVAPYGGGNTLAADLSDRRVLLLLLLLGCRWRCTRLPPCGRRSCSSCTAAST
jgi:hypothetical protein